MKAAKVRFRFPDGIVDLEIPPERFTKIGGMLHAAVRGEREQSVAYGRAGGKKGGFKGGRKSRKPYDVKIRAVFDRWLAEMNDARRARAETVKELARTHGVSPRQARTWIRGAIIP